MTVAPLSQAGVTPTDWRFGWSAVQIVTGAAARAVGRVLPACFFALMARSSFGRLEATLERAPTGAGPLVDVTTAGYQALTALFLGTVAALFLVRKPSVTRSRGVLPFVAAIAGTFVINLLKDRPVTLPHWWVALAASLLLAAGMACALTSLLTLGRCFGITPEVRGLVTRGPYRYVRHPLYASEAVAFLGMLLPVLSPLSLFVYLSYVALTLTRAHYEETLLLATFPDYAAYCRRTWKFVPGVW